MKLALTSLLVIIINTGAIAQDINTERNRIEDGWIEKMDDKVAFDLSFNNSLSKR